MDIFCFILFIKLSLTFCSRLLDCIRGQPLDIGLQFLSPISMAKIETAYYCKRYKSSLYILYLDDFEDLNLIATFKFIISFEQ